jgi:hypothetical protein
VRCCRCGPVIIILIAVIKNLHGQPARDSVASGFSYLPKQVIKLGPLHPLNFYPTLQLAYEYRLTRNFTLQADFGYVLTFLHSYNPEFQDKRGVKLKLEARYYLPALIKPRSAHYLSVQPYATSINFDRETQRTECFDLDCTIQFTRWYNYEVKYREQGLAFQYGIHLYGRRITLDVSMGLMLRHVEYKEPPLPRGINEFDEWSWFRIPNEDNRTVIGPTGAIWLGYKLHHVGK